MATVEIALVDEKGIVLRRLTNGIKSTGAHEVSLNESQLPEGMYFVRFRVVSTTGNAFEEMRKVVIVR
jgi:hypothetical protein